MLDDMLRKAPRRRQHHVEGDRVPHEVRVAREPVLRGAHDAPPLLGRQRPGRVFSRLPPFHLDEGEPFAFERYEVDLAHRRPIAACHDGVALEAVEKRGERLGEDAAAIRLDPRPAHLSGACA